MTKDLRSYPGSEWNWYTGWSPPVLEGPIAWDDLLSDPRSIRRRADAALGRPECVVPEGRMRPCLRERCDADAIFALSVLLDACKGLRRESIDWRGRWAERTEGAGNGAAPADGLLHFAWRLHRCRTMPGDVFAPIAAIPQPRTPMEVENVGQAPFLLLAAARLGHPQASAWSVGSHDDLNGAFAAEPVLAYVRRASKQYMMGSYGDGLQLPYLVAARTLDARRPYPIFDWRGLEDAFGANDIAAASRASKGLLAEGWRPLRERHWIARDGREVVDVGSRDGAVGIVTGDGFLARCGASGKAVGYIPPPGVEEAPSHDAGTAGAERRVAGGSRLAVDEREWREVRARGRRDDPEGALASPSGCAPRRRAALANRKVALLDVAGGTGIGTEPHGRQPYRRSDLGAARLVRISTSEGVDAGGSTEDVSIRQRAGDGDYDWVTHDLIVNGQPLERQEQPSRSRGPVRRASVATAKKCTVAKAWTS